MTQAFTRVLVSALVIGWIVGVSAPSHAACGDAAGDAQAVSTVRAQITETCNCSAASGSHSHYVGCAARVVRSAEQANTLSPACGRTVMKCAVNSTVGRPGAVACCTTSSTGMTKASIKSNARLCKAPVNGSACVGYAISACDACTSTGCYIPPSPTPTPSPSPTPVICPQLLVPLPNLIEVPLTLQNGTANCGGVAFTPPASPPFSGEVDDVNGAKLADLGLSCQYANNMAPLSLQGGLTTKMSVAGLSGTAIVLGPSNGTGPTDCTRGAGPDFHCVNGAAGTDGSGACSSDADCGVVGQTGACALDAHCFFGAPIPTMGIACLVNTLLTDICGSADLSGNTQLAATIAARVYLSGCPQCINGMCDSGANAGQSCTQSGFTVECLPDAANFAATLTVPLAPLTTATTTLTETDGRFCPVPPRPTPTQQPVCPPKPVVPMAFGLANAGSISETGQGLVSSNLLHITVGATFCIPANKTIFSHILGLPAPGALSVTGQLDLTNALPSLQLLGLPIP